MIPQRLAIDTNGDELDAPSHPHDTQQISSDLFNTKTNKIRTYDDDVLDKLVRRDYNKDI